MELVDRAEVVGQRLRCDEPDARQPERVEHPFEGPRAGGVDRGDEVPRRGLAEALHLHQPLLGQVVDVGDVGDQALVEEDGGLLFPQPLDVHRALGDEVFDVLPVLPRAAAPVRADRPDRALPLFGGSFGETTCGITSPARITTTSSPSRTSLRARSSSLWRVAVETVTPPTWTGSSIANGTRCPVRPTFQTTFFIVVVAVVGGNFQAIAQRGSRPTTPSSRQRAFSSTFTTTPSIS